MTSGVRSRVRAHGRRLSTLAVAGALVCSACGGDSDRDGDAGAVDDRESAAESAGETSSAGSPTATTGDDAPIQDARDATRATAAVVEDGQEWAVTMDVTVAGSGDGFGISMQAEPSAWSDPFGEFAACSGWRTHVGAYSVFVSGADQIDFLGLSTPGVVSGPGIYDADVRVQMSGETLTATGTLTLLDGLQAGTFAAFGADGGRVEGSFTCDGSPAPTVLTIADPGDGTLDSVEVFALLRNGRAERVVGMATDDARVAACPAVEGGRGDDALVSAVGDASLGSITGFELTGTSLEIVVGSTTYSMTDVAVETTDGIDGTFGGVTADGVSIDGAFRCS